ncbi:MAG: hypothetical protein WA584_19565 [Pyrinomonadaceae bacterium]
MLRKFLSVLTMSSILLISSSLAFGKSQSDWAAVENLVNQEAAVKLQNGKMNYGMVKSVASDKLVLQIAGSKTLTQNEITISRAEIGKIWRALLFVNDRNIGKGALIGAAVGGVALGIPAVTAKEDDFGVNDGLAGAAILIGALGGALIGGVAGYFAKTKHKKRDLVYKN